jgi:hypothetical protein
VGENSGKFSEAREQTRRAVTGLNTVYVEFAVDNESPIQARGRSQRLYPSKRCDNACGVKDNSEQHKFCKFHQLKTNSEGCSSAGVRLELQHLLRWLTIYHVSSKKTKRGGHTDEICSYFRLEFDEMFVKIVSVFNASSEVQRKLDKLKRNLKIFETTKRGCGSSS